MKYAISSCLCGVNCKYNGKNNLNPKLKELYDNNEAILICPEVLGLLSIPRDPFEIKDGRAITINNKDVTDNVINGANKALSMIKENGIIKVILKEGSPSCGVNYIYDGTFSHTKIKEMGIATKMFKENNLVVISDEDYNEEE